MDTGGGGCPISPEIEIQLLLISLFRDGSSWLANKCSGFGYSSHIVYVGRCLTEDINFMARQQPGEDPAQSPPLLLVLMTLEPCCEEPDQTPSIQVAGKFISGSI